MLQLLFDPKINFVEDDFCRVKPECVECSVEAVIEHCPPTLPLAIGGQLRLRRTFKPVNRLEYMGQGPTSLIFHRMKAGTLTKTDWAGSPVATSESIAIVEQHIPAGKVPADRWKDAYHALEAAGKIPMDLC